MTEIALPSSPSSPRRLFYGWPMLGITTLTFIASAPGQSNVVSQFNTSFREDLGLSAAALGTAYMVGTVCAAFPLVFVGRASDKFGPRAVTAVITIAFGLACASIGLVHNVVALTIAFFALRFLGQGSLALLSGHALALWFDRRLGTANGIKLVFVNIAFAGVPFLALFLIERIGWRLAYPALGALVCLMLLPPVLLFARNRPEEVGQHLDGDAAPLPEDESGHESLHHTHTDPAFTLAQALRTRAYWVIALVPALSGLIGTALIFHAQPILGYLNVAPENAALVLGTWSITATICVFPAGWIADRLKPGILFCASLLLLAVSTLLPLLPMGIGAMHACMAVFAVSQSLALGVAIPTLARYFGRAHHGSIRGSAMIVGVAGTGLGPVTLGLSMDRFDSIAPALAFYVAICIPVFIGALLLAPPTAPEHETPTQ